MSQCIVMADGKQVGVLSVAGATWSFEYAALWDRFPLSPSLALATRIHCDQPTRKPVEWFFENLLPEGRLRELIARRDRIDARDTWALLVRHGQDTAGALSLLADGSRQARKAVLMPISAAQLQRKIVAARSRHLPLMASWNELRMSLAGAQEKLGLRIDAAGNMFIPQGSAASTHIVKPDNASSDFPFCPANEFFCMRLARELAVPVPPVDLLHLPEPLYVVARFDRAPGKAAAVRRIHQIDLCQMLGVAPSKKYESEGGLGLHDLFGALNPGLVERPIVATRAVIQWIVFNYLIGNLDAHAKNIGFLIPAGRARVAPFYDLLCVEAYLPRQPMAMAMAGENRPGWIEATHWDSLARDAGIAPGAVRQTLSTMIEGMPAAIAGVIDDARIVQAERDFLRKRVVTVIEERISFAREAIKQWPAGRGGARPNAPKSPG